MAKEFFKNLPDETTPYEAERFNDLFDGGESLGSIVVNDVICKNMFNKNEIIMGVILNRDTGETATNLGYAITDYIPVEELETYTMSNFNSWYTCYYDADKNYVSPSTGSSTITIPKGAKYFRTSLLLTNLDIAQIEKGPEKTSYTPHRKYGYNSEESMGNIIVDNIKSKNLFNKYLFNTFTDSLQYLDLTLEPNTTYTMSSNLPAYASGTYTNLFFANNGETLKTDVNGVFPNKPRTLTTDATGKVQIAYRDGESALNDEINKYWFQIEKGSIATENTTFKNFEMLNPIEIITPTIDWTKISQASAYKAYKIGNIAFLVLTCKITATIENTDVLATGLPKPFIQVGFYANNKNLIINTNGELVNNYSSLSNIGWLYILVCYPCQS